MKEFEEEESEKEPDLKLGDIDVYLTIDSTSQFENLSKLEQSIYLNALGITETKRLLKRLEKRKDNEQNP